jgi:hypothetical protein
VYTALAVWAGAARRIQTTNVSRAHGCAAARAENWANENAELDLAQAGNSRLIRIAGAIALLALLICITLPFWVVMSESPAYVDRLEHYRVWLAWASVTHLVACAVWVMAKES